MKFVGFVVLILLLPGLQAEQLEESISDEPIMEKQEVPNYLEESQPLRNKQPAEPRYPVEQPPSTRLPPYTLRPRGQEPLPSTPSAIRPTSQPRWDDPQRIIVPEEDDLPINQQKEEESSKAERFKQQRQRQYESYEQRFSRRPRHSMQSEHRNYFMSRPQHQVNPYDPKVYPHPGNYSTSPRY